MKELFSFKIGDHLIKIADIHVAVAAALLMGLLAVAALT